jgi:hypothetical protein
MQSMFNKTIKKQNVEFGIIFSEFYIRMAFDEES